MFQSNRKIVDFVSDSAIVFVCVAIKYAIWEYKTGRRLIAKFEVNSVKCKFGSLVEVDI